MQGRSFPLIAFTRSSAQDDDQCRAIDPQNAAVIEIPTLELFQNFPNSNRRHVWPHDLQMSGHSPSRTWLLGFHIMASTSRRILPARPELLTYDGVARLFELYEEIFLGGRDCTRHTWDSRCGYKVTAFDHNFFHMVKLDHHGKPKPLLIDTEKATIRSLTDGFGPYTHDKQRGIYLRSAFITMIDPDEVWEPACLDSADWAFVKHFDAMPYCCTVLLTAHRPTEKSIAPVTSFRGRRRDIRKYCCGKRIYP